MPTIHSYLVERAEGLVERHDVTIDGRAYIGLTGPQLRELLEIA